MADKKEKGNYRIYLGAIFNVDHSKVLVAENVFNHKQVVIESGTTFKPFYEVKKVVNAKGVKVPGNLVEPIKANCRDIEGTWYEVGCKIAWISEVVDPQKIYNARDPKKRLEDILNENIKCYVKGRTYDELERDHFKMDSDDGKKLQQELDEFEEDVGVRVSSIRITDIIPSKELLEDRQKRAQQAIENANEQSKLENQIEMLEFERKIKEYLSQINIEELRKRSAALGISIETLIKFDMLEKFAINSNIQCLGSSVDQYLNRFFSCRPEGSSLNNEDEQRQTPQR